jgi:hypothetical protein
MRYVFNDSYNVIRLSSLYPYFNVGFANRDDQPSIIPDGQRCGAFVCFSAVPTQTVHPLTGKDIANVLYAEPILFAPKNHKITVKGVLFIKMPINFTMWDAADLKYAKDTLGSQANTPEVPYKVTFKIIDKNGGNGQLLKFYKHPRPFDLRQPIVKELAPPVIRNKTLAKKLPPCFTTRNDFHNMFMPTGAEMLLYEDAFPSADYIYEYDALGNPVAHVLAEIETNVDNLDVPEVGPCGIWLKCMGFEFKGDCHGAFAEVNGVIPEPQYAGLGIEPDPFPQLGPRYLIIEYKPQGASNVTGYEGDGITFDYRRSDVQRRGPMAVAPNSPGDIGALGIWIGGKFVRRMGNADGTELRVVIPITTQTGAVELNYIDIPGLYGDNRGKWHFEVYFGRDCLRYPISGPVGAPQPQPIP